MTRKTQAPEPAASASRSWTVVFSAVVFFATLAMLPVILPALHLQLHPTAPQSSYGVKLMVAPRQPTAVRVPAVARPIAPGQAPASLPAVDAAREAATVAAEDKRLRTMLHAASRVFQPEVVPIRGSLPTLVLTAGSGSYTAQTLVQYGALVMLPHHAALLIDNLYVSTNATLSLGGPSLRTLYLDNGSGGFATIVGWNGNLKFAGTARHPMTIMGWDRSASAPAADQGYGRSYIREAGGKLTLTDVRVSSLGFWSGRSGGVSWTGLTGAPSTGGAVNSTFTNDTYGAFVSRGSGVTFRGDLFEYNQLDGVHVHRYSLHTTVVGSSAVRNGANGFIVSPAAQGTLLEDDISQHNGGNGFFLNGRPLATGASASGGSVSPGTGTGVEYSAALGNAKIGVLVEGGLRPVVKGDQVCGGVTAIEVKDGAANAVVTGNTIACAPRSGISVGPAAPGTVLAGNAVDHARTAFLIRNSGPVQLDKNTVTGATVFGVSARGISSSVRGVGNTIAGSGFRAVDYRADAPAPSLYGSNLSGWTYHARVTFWSYLQFHPLAAMWLGIATLLLLAFVFSRRRRALVHPYPASTRWRPEPEPAEAAAAITKPGPALTPGFSPAGSFSPAGGFSSADSFAPAGSFSRADSAAAAAAPRTASSFAKAPGFMPSPGFTASPGYSPSHAYSPAEAAPAAAGGGRPDDLDEFEDPEDFTESGDDPPQPLVWLPVPTAEFGDADAELDALAPAGPPGYGSTGMERDGSARPPWDTMPMPQLRRGNGHDHGKG